jgi:phage shock protein A
VLETIFVPADKLVRIPPRPGGPRRSPEAPCAPRRPRLVFPLTELLPMSIFSRTRDIVAANVSDLLDKAEDPAKMIRMIILEMEETLVEVRSSAARTIADQKEMRRQIARLDRLQESWAEKAELALSRDREDLARGALVEKRKAAEAAEGLRSEIDMLDEAMRASEADIGRLQGKLREARMRQSATQTRLESANRRVMLREMTVGPRVDEAFSRFDELERQVDDAEGRAEALALAAPPRTLDDQIAELRNAGKVDAELEAMKARLAAGRSEG